MARTFVSPMGDPTFANGVSSLAEALFPSAATQARAKMLGAQYQGQLASNEQTGLENVALADQNNAWAGGPQGTGMTQEQFARARLGRDKVTPQGLAEMMLKDFELIQRGDAVARADAAGYGVNAPLIGLSNSPLQFNQIDGGYQLDKYMPGGKITATGKTNAEIRAENAQAASSYASAGAARALEAQRRDEIKNPQKYRTSNGADPKPLAAGDSKLITAEILARIPKGAEYSEADLAAAIGEAENLRAEGMPIGQATARAFDSVFGLNAKPVTPTRDAGVTDGLWDWVSGAKIPEGAPRLERKPAAAAPAPAPAPVPRAPEKPSAQSNPKVQRIPASQHQAAVDAANRAVQNGADPEAVRQRLKDMGVTLRE